MLSKSEEAKKRASYLRRQSRIFIDKSVRTWYMLGQEWFDMEGRIDDEVIGEMPETQRVSILMGFNAAKWARDTAEPQAVRGGIRADNLPGTRSTSWYGGGE